MSDTDTGKHWLDRLKALSDEDRHSALAYLSGYDPDAFEAAVAHAEKYPAQAQS